MSVVAGAELGLKIDVCTYAGLRDGVPALLRLFDELGVRASFFVALGPDHSGRAIRRIFRPGFLAKMRRTNAVSTYGWRTVLYGTLLPGPQIARSCRDVLRRVAAAGHEVAMHGYDHVYWQDRLPHLSADAVAAEMGRARATYEEVLGSAPQAFGAPGWQCTPASFAAEDALGLVYHSDTRGHAPFVPQMSGRQFATLEIPVTLPTLDECYGTIGTTPEAVASYYAAQLHPGLNVYTAHAEMEGIGQLPHLRAFLEAVRPHVPVHRLIDIARGLRDIPPGTVVPGPIEGRHGTVALQVAHG